MTFDQTSQFGVALQQQSQPNKVNTLETFSFETIELHHGDRKPEARYVNEAGRQLFRLYLPTDNDTAIQYRRRMDTLTADPVRSNCRPRFAWRLGTRLFVAQPFGSAVYIVSSLRIRCRK